MTEGNVMDDWVIVIIVVGLVYLAVVL